MYGPKTMPTSKCSSTGRSSPAGDSGIYLRGSPQVQIWDPAKWPQGSGGLYNNKKNPSDPLVKADHPVGEWNRFRIRMVDEVVSVWLNDKLVVDNVILENYWDRSQPIFPTGQIELQNHGSTLWFRNVFIRQLMTVNDVAKTRAAVPDKARVKPRKPRKVLCFDRCTGLLPFVHPHRQPGGQISWPDDRGPSRR